MTKSSNQFLPFAYLRGKIGRKDGPRQRWEALGENLNSSISAIIVTIMSLPFKYNVEQSWATSAPARICFTTDLPS